MRRIAPRLARRERTLATREAKALAPLERDVKKLEAREAAIRRARVHTLLQTQRVMKSDLAFWDRMRGRLGAPGFLSGIADLILRQREEAIKNSARRRRLAAYADYKKAMENWHKQLAAARSALAEKQRAVQVELAPHRQALAQERLAADGRRLWAEQQLAGVVRQSFFGYLRECWK